MSERGLTPEDLWALPRVGAPAPLPDGQRVVVPVTRYDTATDEGTTRLYLVAVGDDAAPHPLTTAEASSTAPAVSPDGSRLAFLRKPGGEPADDGSGPRHPDKPQLYVLPLDGGEAERLTDLPLGAADPRWMPGGRRVAFAAPLYRDAPTPEGTAELRRAKRDDKVSARATEDRVYRYWDTWLTDGEAHHLFVLDLETGALVDLTPGMARWIGMMSFGETFDIAPDGREIAFEACRTDPPYRELAWGLFRVAVPEDLSPDGDPPPIEALTPEGAAHARGPRYSPDGRRLLFGIQRELDFYADATRLCALDRATGDLALLTDAWDRSAEGWAFADDPGTAYVAAQVAGRRALFALDLDAAIADPEGAPPRELLRGAWPGDPRPAGGRLFFTHQALDHPPEVASCAPDGSDLRIETGFTADIMTARTMGAVGELSVRGADGDDVQVLLVYPPGTDAPADGGAPDAPLPLVHLIHGGPHGVFGDQWHWRWSAQAIAASGRLVALVNFHGSTGSGDAFTRSILGRWGDQPYRDVMAATDMLVERGFADPERMAAAGGSYGGYLVSWIAGHTDRFRCLINHAGVCDFQTQNASDVTQGRRRSMGGELWDDLAGLDRYNPLRHASGFRSPMLVLHGEKDYRVPYAQGLQIYNVYQAMALPARLVVYPDENHWILKPNNSLHWYGEFLGWLDRWLGTG